VRPVVPCGRVVGLDVARALALVAMMATHILPDVGPDGSIALNQQLAGGRASGLFAVLAGVSVSLISGRTTPQRGRERLATSAGLAVRAVLIAVVGLLLAEVDSGIAVILTYYGLLFLLALPFLGMGARALAVASAVTLTAVPVLSHLVRPLLPEARLASPELASLAEPAPLLAELLLTGYYPALPWLAYLLAGMTVGRLDLSQPRMGAGIAAVGAWVAALSMLLSLAALSLPGVRRTLAETFTGLGANRPLEVMLERGLYGTTPTGSWWWLTVRTPHTATPFDLAHTIGTALLVIGVAMLVGRALPRALAVVGGAGAMTLTLYSAHVLSRAPGWWDADTLETFFGQVAVVLVVGAAFRVAQVRGPLEAVVARVQSAVRRAAARTPRT